MASFCLLLLSTALLHAAQALPAGRGGGRGLDVSVGEARRQRRDLPNLLPYEDRMMSYPYSQGGGGANDPYYQSDGWNGRGLDQALQRLVERDQRRSQEEEQRAEYLAALLRLLSEAESAGLVNPGDVEVVEEEEDEEDDQETPGDFQGPAPPDYDETGGRGLNMGRPPAAWWGLLEPQLAQALLDRMEPQVAQTLLERARQERLRQAGRLSSGPSRAGEQEALRRLVAKLLSSIGPNNAAVMSSGRRMRRDVSFTPPEPISSAHRRTRRSLDDLAPPSPSDDPPLLRVKRLDDVEEDEEKLRPAAAGLQRMKRIDTMAPAMEELNHGSRRRRRRAVLNYDPQILIDQILDYMRE
ncbi:proprotein convertase subtilisin/kexin type 1 inhibitor, like [Tautogolabrus adspersus]